MKKNDKQGLTLEEKLVKLSIFFPLIPHTNSGRLYSTVRKMKAEQEMNIPINLRSGFAISVATGKAANQMNQKEWQDFFLALSKQLKKDYPNLYQQIFPIPKGLIKCPICGEYKGKTKAKNLNWDYPSGIDLNQIISTSCLCDGIICPKCHITKIHKPVSNQYDQETNTIWHSPWFAAQAGCDNCRQKNH